METDIEIILNGGTATGNGKREIERFNRALLQASALERFKKEERALERLVVREMPDGGEREQIERDIELVECGFNPDGTLTIVGSDETLDRWGDIIEVNGWELEEYAKNPVILVDHSYRVQSIVGRSIKTRVANKQLLFDVLLDPPDSNMMSKIVRSRIEAGSLRTVSVGFLPLEWKKILDDEGNWTYGYRFTKVELLELSFVAVPANPNALILSNGIENENARILERISKQLRLARIVSQLRKGMER